MNLLEQLSSSKDGERSAKFGRWLLFGVVASSLAACFGLPACLKTLLNLRGGPFFDLAICFWNIGLGVVVATPFLVSACFALLDAPWGIRIAGIAFSYCAAVACLALGLMFAGVSPNDFDMYVRNVLPAIPGVAASISLPFIVLRYLLGWQIVVKSWNRPPQRQQVSIAGMMISTFVASTCLVGFNVCSSPGNAIAVCAMAAGVALVLLVPYSYWMLRSKSYWSILLIVSAVVFALGFGVGFLIQLIQARGQFRAGAMLQLSCMLTAAFVWLGLGLIAIRQLCGDLVLHRDIDTLYSESRESVA